MEKDFKGDIALLNEAQETALTNIMAQLSSQSLGIEGEESSSPKIPVLKIKQAMTSDPGCPADCTDGDLYTTGKKLENPVKIAPVYFWRSRVMFEGGKFSKTILCSSPDAITGTAHGSCGKRNSPDQCEFSRWGGDGTPPQCQEVINCIALQEDLSGLVHIRFSKTSFGAGRTLMTLCKSGGNIWSRLQFLKSKTKSSGNTDFYIFDVTTTGVETDAGLQEIARHFCVQYGEARKSFLESFSDSRTQSNVISVEALTDSSVTTDKGVTVTNLSEDDDPDFQDTM